MVLDGTLTLNYYLFISKPVIADAGNGSEENYLYFAAGFAAPA
ncbi:hypothetical protein [Paenibacillus eucommiae]|uniref:Uncharacterized protein n=1 Tax=Paenibacillus eucommiae TaxID=1355755 RepID=A0ABS4J313_9BACL|nr:hypothetical protein [Paenibacillus eucommiae]MBP1994239.1 hypothetical protein [Paenibacillus eucommiae]